jgi:hypothetical protein
MSNAQNYGWLLLPTGSCLLFPDPFRAPSCSNRAWATVVKQNGKSGEKTNAYLRLVWRDWGAGGRGIRSMLCRPVPQPKKNEYLKWIAYHVLAILWKRVIIKNDVQPGSPFQESLTMLTELIWLAEAHRIWSINSLKIKIKIKQQKGNQKPGPRTPTLGSLSFSALASAPCTLSFRESHNFFAAVRQPVHFEFRVAFCGFELGGCRF